MASHRRPRPRKAPARVSWLVRSRPPAGPVPPAKHLRSPPRCRSPRSGADANRVPPAPPAGPGPNRVRVPRPRRIQAPFGPSFALRWGFFAGPRGSEFFDRGPPSLSNERGSARPVPFVSPFPVTLLPPVHPAAPPVVLQLLAVSRVSSFLTVLAPRRTQTCGVARPRSRRARSQAGPRRPAPPPRLLSRPNSLACFY